LQPLLDLRQPVGTPEGLAIDDEPGCAAHALGERRVGLHLEPLLDLRRADAGGERRRIDAEAGGDVLQHGEVGNVAAVHPVGAEDGMGERPRPGAVLPVQPVVGARRRNGRQRELRRKCEGHAVVARRAGEVAHRIFALQRHIHQQRLAGLLEHHAEQHRPPLHLAAVLLRQSVDHLAGDVGIRRGEVEIELDRFAHHSSTQTRLRPMTRRWMSLAPS
jgi:hypothetical protein